ncbi:MAG: methionyl-tRNA formyltransferase [Clostridiales bacterium]|nr:methionyl-tRNA formyltransferase [Clostridiales bacterium]
MKILFMGTPDFAVKSLAKLHEDGYEISAVFTQEDRIRGRGNKLSPSPVKTMSNELGLKVYHPRSLKSDETIELVKKINPDIIVVVAYGKILPKEILDIPPHGCVNIHASLLPKYRGAAPIQWAIINGEKETGVTSMLMDVGMDTGDILLSRKTPIAEDETSADLFIRLADLGADLLIETIKAMQKGVLEPKIQDESQATYAPMLDKSMCEIDWEMSAQQINNLIRGLSPFFCACSKLDGKRVRFIESEVSESACDLDAGEIICKDGSLIVACGNDSALEIKMLQAEGKKAMDSEAYLLGNKIEEGNKFE